jgi:S-adenosylmethionine:tRNA ribosyltransferase-isomerase
MNAAKAPRRDQEAARLLVVDADTQAFTDARICDLPDLLEPGDVLIVNDAATLPASFPARSPSGQPMEIRLAQPLDGGQWRAVLFGAGDWRIPTELRDPPEDLLAGEVVEISETFSAEIVEVASLSSRLVTLRFNRSGPDFWSAVYAYGRPIQYAYHESDLPLWSVQTSYASRPWSVEMPSAGRPLTWRILFALRRRGVRLAWLTHCAGLSAAGDDDLDAALPLDEHYDIPQSTVDAIREARTRGSRVVAAGTTVVRALEGAALHGGGELRAGTGKTGLIIDRKFSPVLVDAILTGLHDPAQSHFKLVRAFAGETILRRAWRHANDAGYLCHEFGDLCLIWRARFL